MRLIAGRTGIDWIFLETRFKVYSRARLSHQPTVILEIVTPSSSQNDVEIADGTAYHHVHQIKVKLLFTLKF